MPKGFNRHPGSFIKRISKKDPEDIEPVKPFQLIEGGRAKKPRKSRVRKIIESTDPDNLRNLLR